MKKLLVILMLLPFYSFGQVNLDSLWDVWNDEKQHDTNRLKAIHKIARNGYLYTKPDSAFHFAQLQYDFAKRKGLKKQMADALNTQGGAYWIQGNFPSAMDYFTRSLTIREEVGDKKGIGSSINNIGLIYQEQGDYAKAIDYFTRSLNIREEVGDKNGIASSLANIGAIYFEQRDFANAIDYQNRSLTISEEIGDKLGIASSLGDIGTVYQEQGDHSKEHPAKRDSLYNMAMGHHTRSLTIKEEIGNVQGMSNTLNNIGLIYKEQGDYTSAIDYYTRSLAISEEIGDKPRIGTCLVNMGILYTRQEDYHNAIASGTRALTIAKELGATRIIWYAAYALHNVYKVTGKHKQALEMYELYIVARDSVTSEQNQKEIIRQRFKYDYEKKEAVAKAEHEAELERQEEVATAEKKRQNIIIGSVGSGLGLVVIFSIFLFNRFRVTRRQKKVIEEQKEEVDMAYGSLEEKNTEIMDSIQYAKRIQSAILPPQKLVKQYLEESFILFKPKDIVAGDFYWMETEGDNIFFTAADCTGHGVPGAMVSVMCSTALSKAVKELGIYEPAKILDKTVELLEERFEKSEEEVKDGMDLALCCLNIKTNELQYAGANNPLYHLSKGEIKEIKADKQPVGRYEGRKPFTNHTIQLQKGESIYIFSDGFADQFGGPKGKKFKYKPFRELLLTNQDKSMEEQKQLLDECIENWRGELEQVDDICIIGMKV